MQAARLQPHSRVRRIAIDFTARLLSPPSPRSVVRGSVARATGQRIRVSASGVLP